MMAFASGSEQGVSRSSGMLWSIILAGGEGTRLRPLVLRIHSDARPKQFAVLVGERSLLRQTLDRSALLVPPERTVVVATRTHAQFFAGDSWGEHPPRVLLQPSDRGTAAGVLLPVHRIERMDPGATVLVFPSDHYVGDDDAFMVHAERMAAATNRHPLRILLAGVPPDAPETGYGWIEPGMTIERNAWGPLSRIARFVEKPTEDAARALMSRGGLWNTFVMAARVRTLIAAGRRTLPLLHDRLARIGDRDGDDETRGIESAYRLAPTANFSQGVLAAIPEALAVAPMPGVAWSDWGTPDRVIQTLRRAHIEPAWMRRLAPTA
jgi:mannose-1-phosphate guanylyltransferase